MRYRVLVQPSAFQDIETAYRWMCDHFTPNIANQWYYSLQDAITSLQEFPNRGAIAPEASIFGREIRQLWVGKQRRYRVIFVVEQGTVAILHIRHSRQAPLEGELEL
jgi:plasmid stabilization system protein ParE